MNWDERFELAKKYYEHYGNLRVVITFKTKDGYTFDKDGFKLGKWLNNQRRQYRLGEITTEHYEKLKSIGMIFENLNDLDWDTFYTYAQIYYTHYGHLSIPHNFRTKNGYESDERGKNLGAWFRLQKYHYNKKALSDERMNKIGNLLKMLECDKQIAFDKKEDEWNKLYVLAQTFFRKYGHLSVPCNFKTKNGYDFDETGENLGLWIRNQRKNYKKGLLTEEKIELLEQISMVFTDEQKVEWERMYTLAKAYYEHYGDLQVPRYFRTKNGYTPDNYGSNLGIWVNKQYCRKLDHYLSKDEISRLEAIGMIFENQKEKNWQEMYNLAKLFYEHHKHLRVPTGFKTENGYGFSDKGIKLGAWINAQRKEFFDNKLSKKHTEQLKRIGMIFKNLHDVKWEKMYELAKIYYQHHNNLIVSREFRTKDGYTYSAEGEKLGAWLYYQQNYHKSSTLYEEREEKLKQIGMVFEKSKKDCWQEMYALAVNYYKQNHHLRVRESFKTKNGIDYDPNGEELGLWILEQRRRYKVGALPKELIVKLQTIGMLFEIRKDKGLNQKTCQTYDIDYKLYKKQIDLIPHREFGAKINFLNSQGLPFTVGNQLNPIFFMSDINIQTRFGITLESLINNYEKSLKVKVL